MLHGLARADLNGTTGTVRKYDAAKGRYAVTMYNGTSILLREDNLKPKPPDDAAPSVSYSPPVIPMDEEGPSKDALLHELHQLLKDGMLKADLLKKEGDERAASEDGSVAVS